MKEKLIILIALLHFPLLKGNCQNYWIYTTFDRAHTVYSSYEDSTYFIFDKNNNKTNSYYLSNEKINSVYIGPFEKSFLFLTKKGSLLQLNIEKKQVILIDKNVTEAICKDSMIFYSLKSGEIGILNPEFPMNGKKIKLSNFHLNTLSVSSINNQIVTSSSDGYIYLIDWKKQVILNSRLQPFGKTESVSFFPETNNIVAFFGSGASFFSNGLNGSQKVLSFNEYFTKPKLFFQTYFTAEYYNQFSQLSEELVLNFDSKSNYLNYQYTQSQLFTQKDFFIESNRKSDSVKILYKPKVELKNQEKENPDFIYEAWLEIKPIDSSLIIIDIKGEKIKTEPKELKTSFTKKDIQQKTILPSSKQKTTDKIEILPQFGYAAPLKEMFFSADGKKIVTIAESPIIKIWDREKVELIKEIKISDLAVLKATIHPSLPLLVVMDRSYVLYFIDLDKLQIINTIAAFNQKFDYLKSYDEFEENNFQMKFTSKGNVLSMIDTSLHSQFEYIPPKYKYPIFDQFNYPLEEILKGIRKNIECDNEISYSLGYNTKLSSVVGAEYDTLYADFISGKNLEIAPCSNDTLQLCFKKYGNEITETPISDSLYFVDATCKKPINFNTREVPEYFYRKKDLPEPRSHRIYLRVADANDEYRVLDYSLSHERVLYSEKSKKKLKSITGSVGVFINNLHAVYLDTTGIFILEDSVFIDFSPFKNSLHKEYIRKYSSKYINYFNDTIKHELLIWNNSFDHNFLVYDFKTKQLNEKSIPKPDLGHVKASFTHPECFINYRNRFCELNFENLTLKNWYLFHVIDNKNDSVVMSISKNIGSDYKPIDNIKFYYSQNSFINQTEIPNLDFFSFYHQFDLHIMNNTDGKNKRLLANTSTSTLAPNICWRKCDPVSVDDCFILCNNEFKIYDTLVKYNFYQPKLSPKQRELFSSNQNNYEYTGAASRLHGKAEFLYLEDFGLAAEFNDIDIHHATDYIDSIYFARLDEKFALEILEVNTKKIWRKFNSAPVGSFQINFIPYKKQIATFGYDGAVRVFDINGKSKDPLFTFFNNENGYIFLSPDNYYKTNSRNMNLIKFRKGDKIYGIEQFDLKFNRPDILLQRINNADSILIQSYYKAYLKRLKKMGFTEEMLKDDFHLPEVKIKNFEYLPSVTDSSDVNLDLDIWDTKYKLDRINIYINDVPIYGTAGIDLRKENTQSISKNVNLELTEGENKIQVSILNQAGAESYKETVYVTYKPKKSTKPDLYLITIGDSKYKDNRYDLTYASKDASDIATAFQNNSSYKKVNVFTYTDDKVTRENILSLKNELKKAKRDDVVIITVAGHGVLDEKLDYYLATHDMDFTNPSEKGIPYEELESLLDGIAPLKKVLFLDACHSGEVDKEEVEQIAMNTSTSGSVKFRSAGAGIQKKNLGLKTTSELMGELFTDLRRGTGATIISSAGGAEFAMESDEWKNGLFTYCLLHGLKDKAADVNKDGQIMLSELQNYLRKEVTSLSNGAQQPTSRIENLSMDFRIW